MKHTKSILMSTVLLLFCTFGLIGADAFPKLDFIQTNENGLYKCGDKVTFTVTAKDGKQRWTKGKLRLILRDDLVKQLSEQTYELKNDEQIIVNHIFAKPGFITVSAEYLPEGGGKVHHYWTVCGAGADPEKIEAGTPPPDDLLAYWQGEYKKLKEKVPAKFEITEMKPSPACKRYLITTDMGDGKHFYAAIAIPKSYNGSKPLPLMVTVCPAGNWGHPCWEYPGFMRMTISVFTREFKDPKDYVQGYFYTGTEKGKDGYFFHDSIIGVMRMLDYVQTRPEWDKKNMIAMGQSQGGGFALIMAALCPKITAVVADVPAMCDHNGIRKGRRGGWPENLLNKYPKFADDARYFDAACFACFIKCPVMMSTGFIDSLCEPASVYAAYNNLTGEKSIYTDPLTGHGYGRKGRMFEMMPADKFIKDQLAKQQEQEK